MAILLLAQTAQKTLFEYRVCKVTQKCVFPGIQQCLAIAGWTQTGMLCTHLSPGATKKDLDTTFTHLKSLGGKAARNWYVVGPFQDHFAVDNAQWRSVDDIKETFQKHFKNCLARRWYLDVSTQRDQYTWGITIEAEPYQGTPVIQFAYKPNANQGQLVDLNVYDFVLF